MSGNEIPVVIRSVSRVATDVVSIELADPDGQRLPLWQPGAHVSLRLPSGRIRQYSLHGDPADRLSYRVAVLRNRAGRGGSIEAHYIAVAGANLRITRPRNNFSLRPGSHHLFLAGGIGVTPLLAMAREIAAQGRPWTFVYGGRSRASMAFVSDLTALPGANVQIVPQDEGGLPDLGSAFASLPSGAIAYCCGPAPMIEAAQTVAQAIRPDVIVEIERFTASREVGSEDDTAFDVTLARSNVTVNVPAGTSILEAVKAVRSGVMSSCREGICSICETEVLEGVPEHRDSVLTPAERATNQYMMICVSRAKSARLVLDL